GLTPQGDPGVKRVSAISQEENFGMREPAATNPRRWCAGPVLNDRSLAAVHTEHTSVAAHVLPGNGCDAFDEAVAFIIIAARGRFNWTTVPRPYRHDYAAREVARLADIEPDRYGRAMVEQDDIPVCAASDSEPS